MMLMNRIVRQRVLMPAFVLLMQMRMKRRCAYALVVLLTSMCATCPLSSRIKPQHPRWAGRHAFPWDRRLPDRHNHDGSLYIKALQLHKLNLLQLGPNIAAAQGMAYAEPLFVIDDEHNAEACKLYLLGKAICGDKLEGLHLTKMGRIAQHMDVHELGHISVPI